MKTAASEINQASFLLKTTEVTARLLLVLGVMMQGSGAPEASPLPSGGTIQPPEKVSLGWHPASSCTTCQGKMLTKELNSCLCINSCTTREMTSLLFPEKRKDTYISKMVREARFTFVNRNATVKCRQETTTLCPCCSGITWEVPGAGLVVKHHLSSGGDLTRSQLCHRFVLPI